jgi:hypothetical protein
MEIISFNGSSIEDLNNYYKIYTDILNLCKKDRDVLKINEHVNVWFYNIVKLYDILYQLLPNYKKSNKLYDLKLFLNYKITDIYNLYNSITAYEHKSDLDLYKYKYKKLLKLKKICVSIHDRIYSYCLSILFLPDFAKLHGLNQNILFNIDYFIDILKK